VRARHLIGLAPIALYLAAFTLAPVLSTLWLSVTGSAGGLTLEHFRQIGGHYQFGEAALNTLGITGLSLGLELSLGLAAALALATRPRAARPSRSCS